MQDAEGGRVERSNRDRRRARLVARFRAFSTEADARMIFGEARQSLLAKWDPINYKNNSNCSPSINNINIACTN